MTKTQTQTQKHDHRIAGPHCEHCGRPADPFANEGYTACCNERVCDGRDKRTFGAVKSDGTIDRYNRIVACCPGAAGDEFWAI